MTFFHFKALMAAHLVKVTEATGDIQPADEPPVMCQKLWAVIKAAYPPA